MPSWLIYSSAPSKGLPLNDSWSFLSALSRNRLASRSSSWHDYSKMKLKFLCQLSLLQSRRKESQSKYLWRDFGVWRSMSKWYDAVYAGRDLPSKPANHTPNSNRSSSKSRLKVTSLTRRTSRRHSCKSKVGRLQEHVALNLLCNEVTQTSTTVTFNSYFWTV